MGYRGSGILNVHCRSRVEAPNIRAAKGRSLCRLQRNLWDRTNDPIVRVNANSWPFRRRDDYITYRC